MQGTAALAADTRSAIEAIRARWPDQVSTAEAVRGHHAQNLTWLKPQPPDAVFFAASTDDVASVVRAVRGGARSDHPLRRRHVARRTDQCAARRRVARPVAHERDPCGSCRGSRLHRAGGRHPQTAQRAHARSRACSFRSIRAPTPRSAAWPRRAHRAPMRCATAPCARTCSALTVVLADGRDHPHRHGARANRRPATT